MTNDRAPTPAVEADGNVATVNVPELMYFTPAVMDNPGILNAVTDALPSVISLDTVIADGAALLPISVLFEPVVSACPAKYPNAVLLVPVVSCSACLPTAVLLLPVDN